MPVEHIRDILEQYCSMREEARDLRRRIDKGERYLSELGKEGYKVADTVKGSRKDLTIGPIKIEGFPSPAYERIEQMTKKRIKRLKILEEDLVEAMDKVDGFIEAIPKSDLRMMFRFYYLDDLTWIQVAHRMNGAFSQKRVKYTADGCRMLHNRYLERKE